MSSPIFGQLETSLADYLTDITYRAQFGDERAVSTVARFELPRLVAALKAVLDEHSPVWVIGGGAVYAAFLPHAGRLVVTEVDLQVDGDTWAPAIGAEWTRTYRTPDDGWAVSATGLAYAVSEYARVAPGPAE